MNAKTAKLLRKAAAGDDGLLRRLKANWYGATRARRAELRRRYENIGRDPEARRRFLRDVAFRTFLAKKVSIAKRGSFERRQRYRAAQIAIASGAPELAPQSLGS